MDAFIQFFTSVDVTLSNKLLEVMYILIGLVSVYTGVRNAKDSTNEKRVGSAVFWIVLGVLFIFGKWIPAAWTGALLFVMVIPAIAGQVDKGKEGAPTTEEMQGNFEHIGMKIFAPAICIGLFALLFALFTKISSLVGMTFGVLVGAVLLLAFNRKNSPKVFLDDCRRMLDVVGPLSMLPTLLAGLGAVFTAAGVGDAFAAITVMTVGIGAPFVLALGADPTIIGGLALTCGYCGTLMTPMAANFNIVPVAILDMKDNYGVIKKQVPIAIFMLVVQIVIMILFGL